MSDWQRSVGVDTEPQFHEVLLHRLLRVPPLSDTLPKEAERSQNELENAPKCLQLNPVFDAFAAPLLQPSPVASVVDSGVLPRPSFSHCRHLFSSLCRFVDTCRVRVY